MSKAHQNLTLKPRHGNPSPLTQQIITLDSINFPIYHRY
jgi:hypothetical protein